MHFSTMGNSSRTSTWQCVWHDLPPNKPLQLTGQHAGVPPWQPLAIRWLS